MTSSLLDTVVNAVLYEGYILYPYRSSSKKNARERFTFGRVYPKDYSDSQKGAESCVSQTECLLRSRGQAPVLEVAVRFLQPIWREVGETNGGREDSFHVMRELTVAGVCHQSWQEATEREIAISVGSLNESEVTRHRSNFSFPAARVMEPLSGSAAILRRHESLQGEIEIEAAPVAPDLFKITVRISNLTPLSPPQCNDQDAVIMRTFASTHTILRAPGSEFISLMDPPAEVKEFADACKNVGTWPVLVGDERKGECDTMLSSPIILYDYPQIAPESAGSFFDGTEIDEMLTLRVLTMTDDEKTEMRGVDDFARRLLERTETVGAENLMKMHGIMREVKSAEDFFNPVHRVETVMAGGQELRKGSNVRIRPKNRADAIDMIIAGKTAVIEAIEQDAEGRIHLAVVLDDDPGKDLGHARQPGHRFFYSVDEVEPVEAPLL
jgi:hypothetical protein